LARKFFKNKKNLNYLLTLSPETTCRTKETGIQAAFK